MREAVSEKIRQNFIVKISPNLFLARNPANRQGSVEKILFRMRENIVANTFWDIYFCEKFCEHIC
jgi:hypothetical protein